MKYLRGQKPLEHSRFLFRVTAAAPSSFATPSASRSASCRSASGAPRQSTRASTPASPSTSTGSTRSSGNTEKIAKIVVYLVLFKVPSHQCNDSLKYNATGCDLIIAGSDVSNILRPCHALICFHPNSVHVNFSADSLSALSTNHKCTKMPQDSPELRTDSEWN